MKFLTSLLFLFLIIFFVVGCEQPRYTDHYQVFIDTYFNVEQIADINIAAATWEDETVDPITHIGLTLDLVVGNCPNVIKDTICIVNEATAPFMASHPNIEGFTLRKEEKNFSTIYIDTQVAWEDYQGDFTMLIAHELGHAFGCEHTLDGLMYHLIGNNSTLTCGDIAQYESYRHQSNITNYCPDGGTYQFDPAH